MGPPTKRHPPPVNLLPEITRAILRRALAPLRVLWRRGSAS
ncbi:MAG TPA: hypothetical protein VN932_12015 [Rhizomicrobium sp.]|nr:hypothetical protein [Rhizomicrobium sp.]